MVNRTGKGWFVKGRSGNPAGRSKDPPAVPEYAPDPAAADRRFIPNVVVEARKYSALAIDTLVELTKDNHTKDADREIALDGHNRGPEAPSRLPNGSAT